jgi:uncharacterized membrane protein YgcG
MKTRAMRLAIAMVDGAELVWRKPRKGKGCPGRCCVFARRLRVLARWLYLIFSTTPSLASVLAQAAAAAEEAERKGRFASMLPSMPGRGGGGGGSSGSGGGGGGGDGGGVVDSGTTGLKAMLGPSTTASGATGAAAADTDESSWKQRMKSKFSFKKTGGA